MSVKTHAQFRIFLMFAGFAGGGILFWNFSSHLGVMWMPAFFALPFGGACLLPLLFSIAVAAACPSCGEKAHAAAGLALHYKCDSCQLKTDGGLELMGGEATLREQIAAIERQAPSRERRILGIFLVLGVLALGVGVFFAIDTVRLVLDGVSADAQVMKVTAVEGRDSDGNRVTNYAAHIQYKAGERPRMLEHHWSVGANSQCIVGCYGQGERLKVIYLPADPATARVNSVAELYLFPALPLSVGLLFIAFAVAMLRKKP